MKFKFVKKVDEPVLIYGGKEAATGDVVEYDGFIAEKCLKNPDFEEVKTRKPKKSADGE